MFLMISAEFLGPSDRVLVVDDFLTSEAAIAAPAWLIEHAGATVLFTQMTRVRFISVET